MMFFLHKMDCGVLGAVEVGEECWREGGREGEKGEGAKGCSGGGLRAEGWHGGQGVEVGGGRGERKMLVIPSVLIAELDGQAERT